MIADVHVLSYSEPVLSLNMTEYDERSTAAAVEIRNVNQYHGRFPGMIGRWSVHVDQISNTSAV